MTAEKKTSKKKVTKKDLYDRIVEINREMNERLVKDPFADIQDLLEEKKLLKAEVTK